ncbi:MAG: hypothetical protein H7X93_08150 [Sphingomonadaceae bacterium]|nr:hypothetical protein [Sphingomonadaceae bacterium]
MTRGAKIAGLAAGLVWATAAAGQDARAAGPPGARDRATVLMSENPAELEFQEALGYADAVLIDGTLYISGVVASFAGGEDTLEAAYERAFARLGRTLERAGGSWRDVVDMISFHTDLTTQLGPITTVKNRYLTAPFPAWTAIQVSRLVPPSGVTEIRLVARIAEGAGAR